jgi:hypothetical protein
MKLPRSCVFVIAVMLALWPTAAHAESDILGWLGELSGPGPFKLKGWGAEGHAWCGSKTSAVADRFLTKWGNCIIENADKVRPVTVAWQISSASTGIDQLFKDNPAFVHDVHELTLSALVMYRANRVLDIGGGVSALRFTVDDDKDNSEIASFWRFGVTPARVVLTPFGAMGDTPKARLLGRVLHLQVESMLIPGGFKASDFGDTKSGYKASAEFQTRLQVLIDVGELIGAARQR